MHFNPFIILSNLLFYTSLTLVRSPVYSLLSYVKILFYNSKGVKLEISFRENSVLSEHLEVLLLDGLDVED
jgi:hypothetical protein